MSAFFALLDDMATLAKLAATQMDDVAALSMKASTKATGLVIDDTAATPQYVSGLAPSRELPIIGKITLGSLKNKAYLTAGLLGLSAALALTPVPIMSVVMPALMAGGTFLAYEGYEKFFAPHHAAARDTAATPTDLERKKVGAAVRTDLILSAEIMSMTFAEVATNSLFVQAGVLVAVGLLMTFGVYGAVAALVKMDDLGLYLAKINAPYVARYVQAFGRFLVRAMAHVFNALSIIGAAAMLWVGGAILMHGMAHFGLHSPEHMAGHVADIAAHATPFMPAFVHWLAQTLCAALLGLIVGAGVAKALPYVLRGLKRPKTPITH